MLDFFIYYLVSNLVCLAIFSIFLIHDLGGVDRQEKQIKFDHALIAFMLYFVSDSFWAAVMAGMIPANLFTVTAVNFSNYLLMAGVTYMWLRYVMSVEQIENRERRLNKFAVSFPFIVSTTALLAVFIFARGVLIDDALRVQPAFNVFLVTVPCINIAAVNVYTIKKAKSEGNPMERRRHVYLGLFPLLVVAGGLVQVFVLPNTPIFCFCCTILMLSLYLQSMETQISLDPLTKLNNRVQLLRYVSQASNLGMEGRGTYVMMLDINRFKAINDTYGHAEGDRALITVADALKKAVADRNLPSFIGRYGGDEFVLIVYAADEKVLPALIGDIRLHLGAACKLGGCPYTLSVSAGYDKLLQGQDTFQKCLQRADKKLYLDKEYGKLGAESPQDAARE